MKHASLLVFIWSSLLNIETIYAKVLNPAVLSHHNDGGNTGLNSWENLLTPDLVSSGKFGKIGSFSVDGPVYAQPLYVPNLEVHGKSRNVLFVATMNNSIYAFDTDRNSSEPLWSRSFINPPSVITVARSDIPGGLTSLANDGILGTPVIALDRKLIYLVARTKEVVDGQDEFFYRLHALDIRTGKVRKSIVIGEDLSAFYPLMILQRSALKIIDGRIVVSFGSQADQPPYHGLVLTFNPETLESEGYFNVTPDADETIENQGGGIWMSGAGPATDESGDIFVATATGLWDGIDNFSDSILRLVREGHTLSVERSDRTLGYFTPPDPAQLTIDDLDVGSGGILILPDNTPTLPRGERGGPPHYRKTLVQGGKQGFLYLLNRDDLGGLNSKQNINIISTVNLDSPIINNEPSASGIFDTPAFFDNTIYICAVADFLKAYTIDSYQNFPATPTQTGPDAIGYPGATPSISSNGKKDAIVWLIDPSAGQPVLRAYDAKNISRDLYNSGGETAGGRAVRFTVPTVAHGKVFVGTTQSVDVYGVK